MEELVELPKNFDEPSDLCVVFYPWKKKGRNPPPVDRERQRK